MSFQRKMWWVAGANPEILEKCPTDYFKFSAIGIMIAVTSLVAFCSGTAAAWYFTSDSQNGGNLFASVLFGIGWAVLIFCIDRCLVITLKKDPGRKRQKVAVPLITRAILACMIALIVSVPVELFLFRDYIAANEEEFMIFETSKLGDLHKRNSHEDDYRTDSKNAYEIAGSLEKESSQLQRDITSLQSRISRLEAEKSSPASGKYITARNKYNSALAAYNEARRQHSAESAKEHPSATALASASARMKSNSATMASAKATMQSAAAEWKAAKQKEIDSLTPQVAKKQSEKAEKDESRNTALKSWQQSAASAREAAAERSETEKKKQDRLRKGNDFIRNFQILDYAINKTDEDGNATDMLQYFAVNLIRLIFFIVELLPTLVKIVTPVGSYDYYVHSMETNMRRYLESDEFRENIRAINEAQLKTQLEETRLRQEAELKMKKEIIESISTVQLDVAKLAIAKWEEKERRKLLDTQIRREEAKIAVADPEDTGTPV